MDFSLHKYLKNRKQEIKAKRLKAQLDKAVSTYTDFKCYRELAKINPEVKSMLDEYIAINNHYSIYLNEHGTKHKSTVKGIKTLNE